MNDVISKTLYKDIKLFAITGITIKCLAIPNDLFNVYWYANNALLLFFKIPLIFLNHYKPSIIYTSFSIIQFMTLGILINVSISNKNITNILLNC